VSLKRRVRRKAALNPSRYSTAPLRGVRTIREFDERYTARLHGFGNAANYYHQASSLRVADRIHIPTLILTAEDDPFVPVEQFAHPAVAGNPNIRVVATPHGGHCGFFARRTHGADDRYWAERTVVDFLAGFMR
jgi:predicted alpha/beta-fold hydrolase